MNRVSLEKKQLNMTQKVAHLSDRGIIQIDGPDADKFLQGLLTNSLEKAIYPSETGQIQAVFCGLLTPQGKILFDFIIIRINDTHFLLDVDLSLRAELIKRLNFYKLRAQVQIQDMTSEFSVLAGWPSGADQLISTQPDAHIYQFAEPRWNRLGQRWIIPPSDINSVLQALKARQVSEDDYHVHRISCAVPEGGKDYVYGDTFPHEACYDLLNGVDFKKGCYVGQEVVSRMQHRGTTRKRIVKVSNHGDTLPASGAEIKAGDLVIGRLGSRCLNDGLALIRLDRAAQALSTGQTITADNLPLTLSLPDWAPYSFSSHLAGSETEKD